LTKRKKDLACLGEVGEVGGFENLAYLAYFAVDLYSTFAGFPELDGEVK